jgi:glucokinase
MSELIDNKEPYPDYVYMTIGTGIGGAIIINHDIFRGTIGFAGEIGHMIINSEFDEKIDNYRKGTLESLAGKYGITKLYQSLSKNFEEITVESIDLRISQGDLNAKKTFDITAFHLTSAILSIVNLLSIPNFIIGGGISKSLYLLKKIEQFVKQRKLLNDYYKINVKAAKHTEQAGIFGAAFMANKYYKQIKD